MSRIAWAVCALGAALTAVPAPADERKPAEVKPAKKIDPTEKVLDALAREVVLPEGTNVNESSLSELFQALGKRHEVNFALNDTAFKAAGHDNIRDAKPVVAATGFAGLTVHQFLAATLDGLGATYLVRNGAIEVVPVRYAAKATKSGVSEDESGLPRLNEPLVSAIVKEKPLNETVARIAEMYDLSVVVGPQAADAKTGFVTARLLNVPADKALELLALQCDLRVVRRGAAYYLTSREHATELFNERLDKERQKIEVEKLRTAPPPVPPAPPEPPKVEEKKP